MSKRKTEQDYHDLAKSRGFKWIGESLPKSTTTSTKWLCPEWHLIKTRYTRVARGSGCRKCNTDKQRHTGKDYYALARKYNLKWIGNLPSNSKENTLWECENGHFFESSYNRIYSGKSCLYCAKSARKLEYHYREIEQQFDIRWIGGKIPDTGHHHTLWLCLICGHKWESKYNNIQQGRGCPACAEYKRHDWNRLTKDDYYRTAQENNLEWIGEFPENSKTHTLWRCSKCGNEWMSCYGNVYAGYGCPACDNRVNGIKVSKQQIKIAELISGELNYQVDNKWIDVALPGRKIAIEYDSWFWHAHKQSDDYARAIELINLGWKVLSIKSNTKIPPIETIDHGIRILSPDTPYHELMMPDWGNGTTWRDVYA